MDEKLPEEISFGEWLHQRRRLLDLTQQQLADQIGCARITLRRIEAGGTQTVKRNGFDPVREVKSSPGRP
jgi:DNA-binding XRE family transcriptional regulator